MFRSALIFALTVISLLFASAQEHYSGIYPHLAYFNDEDECGTGAVVPWADRLWVITYGPHLPLGSSDKLYEITPDLKLTVRPESVGGTPANRMIHRESQQLNIGPYFIDKNRKVRVIPPAKMPGRLTGTARHLTDPANKLYIATMEEGLYEVNVHDLSVTELIQDGNNQPAVGDGIQSELPGYHGKGLYSGQGRLVYANNGENSREARRDPFVPSGSLAVWQGSGDWKLIRRNQFTEVTGPGGIYGSANPATDPLWSIGWDARSLILMCLDGGKWSSYRLPKASHSYDGAHGWNTEWPRIRDIGEKDLLMTMHGMFWRFPRDFTPASSAGITPRSTYLKVIGDFCRWQDRIVLGCDDTAKREFLNKRKIKGEIAEPQSQSNLWFIEPEQLDQLGPVIGRGAVWLNDPVQADAPSDPFLVGGFSRRAVHLITDKPATVTMEVDRNGSGRWERYDEINVDGYQWIAIDPELDAVWIRLRSSENLEDATAWFTLAGEEDDRKVGEKPAKFAGIARVGDSNRSGGLVHARAENERTLEYAPLNTTDASSYYILDGEVNLDSKPSKENAQWLKEHAAIPSPDESIQVDEVSIIYIDDEGKRYRLPRNPEYTQLDPKKHGRFCREVATERDLFNAFGTFYELPARNAGGFNRVRPVSSHNLDIQDYCSYRGLLVLSGVNLEAAGDNRHIIRSDDGKTGLWVGALDDVWELGKPVGIGGPWLDTDVKAGQTSDPYLMTGYDKKTLKLKSSVPAAVTVEVDISGMGDWHPYLTFRTEAGKTKYYQFPDAFQAYWIRFKTDADSTLTAQLIYE
ncbi:MAG TPA: hypothetical protein VJ904_14095 [Tichowtungia sp.]|nr:hypothetical protein [Tichowtungia sp.]